jgi:O-antigen ligase
LGLLGWRAVLAIVAGGAVSWALLAMNPGEWWHRVENFSFRPGIWRQVLADMSDHWVVGHGYLLDPHVQAYGREFDHAHNSYLASLRDGGAIGLALLLAVLTTALAWAINLLKTRGERIYLALLLYGMACIFMDFDRLLVHPKEMWLFFWAPIALVMATHAYRSHRGLLQFADGRTA